MKYCYNITFLINASTRAQQVEWVEKRVTHLRNASSFTGCGAAIAEVIAVPGMSEYGKEETSLTAQFEFNSAEEAQLWGDSHFPIIASAFAKSFGNQAYAMPSIIKMKML